MIYLFTDKKGYSKNRKHYYYNCDNEAFFMCHKNGFRISFMMYDINNNYIINNYILLPQPKRLKYLTVDDSHIYRFCEKYLLSLIIEQLK